MKHLGNREKIEKAVPIKVEADRDPKENTKTTTLIRKANDEDDPGQRVPWMSRKNDEADLRGHWRTTRKRKNEDLDRVDPWMEVKRNANPGIDPVVHWIIRIENVPPPRVPCWTIKSRTKPRNEPNESANRPDAIARAALFWLDKAKAS